MKLKLLDTLSGEVKEINEESFPDFLGATSYSWWEDGGGSCDCNRGIIFGIFNPGDGECLGCRRFLVIEADTEEYSLSELNSDYPVDLLQKYNLIKLNNSRKENIMSNENVNNPEYYNKHPSGVECIIIAEGYSFNLGNAIKYIWRAGLKNTDVAEDLEKARWYLQREINRLKSMRG